MFCWKCGKQNPEGSAFCVYCGSSLNDDPSKMHADIPETSALDAGSAPSQPQSAAQDAGTDEEGTTILGTDEDYTFSPGSGNGGSSYAGQNTGGDAYSAQNTETVSYSAQGDYSGNSSYSAQGGYSGNSSYSAQGGYSGNVPPASRPDDSGKKKTPWIFIVLIAIIAAAVIVLVVALIKIKGSDNSGQENTDVIETTEDAADSTAEDTTESTEGTSSGSGLTVLEESGTSYGLYGETTNENLPGLTVTASIPASADLGGGDILIVTITNTSETTYSLGGTGTYYVTLVTTAGRRYQTDADYTIIPAGESITLQYDVSQAEGEFECIVISSFYQGDSYEGDGTMLSVNFARTKLNEYGGKAE